jgi:hypothetical protein
MRHVDQRQRPFSDRLSGRFHHLCWMADKKSAIALEQRCHQILMESGRHIRGEWLDLTPIEAAKAIDCASIDVNCRLVPHRQLVEMFRLSADPLKGTFWEAGV